LVLRGVCVTSSLAAGCGGGVVGFARRADLARFGTPCESAPALVACFGLGGETTTG